MEIEPLAVPDAWRCIPQPFLDDRGMFAEWFRGDQLQQTTGHRFLPVQANHSVSRRGVVRGLHLADVPPGQAKYVYCAAGAALDVVVDLRTGSPTFGAVDSLVLDQADRRAVFVAEGLGHAFCALSDQATVVYLVSSAYDPTVERTIMPLDPALGLPWPEGVSEASLSPKDAGAPSLGEAIRSGWLPTYKSCLIHYGRAAGDAIAD